MENQTNEAETGVSSAKMTKTVPKSTKRPYTRRQQAGVHTSREQETHENEGSVHDDTPVSFEQSGPLPAIKARPGYVQRWIRVKLGAEGDSQNLYKAARLGYKPRDPGTVPKHLQWMLVQRQGLGGVVGTHDLVLMERREEIHRQHAESNRTARRGLIGAVKQSLFSEHKNLGGRGIEPAQFDSQSTVQTGRRPMIQDD